jgi:hypothetical protein
MIHFGFFSGIITAINDFTTGAEQAAGCYIRMTLEDINRNIVNFVVAPDTYFVDHITMEVGDAVTGFYDANAPTLLIYPPQYNSIVMAEASRYQNVKVDYFDSQLVSSDGSLRLNIAPSTQIILENDQAFTRNPANRDLIVVYGATTRSIPAQITPYKIIVMCQ